MNVLIAFLSSGISLDNQPPFVEECVHFDLCVMLDRSQGIPLQDTAAGHSHLLSYFSRITFFESPNVQSTGKCCMIYASARVKVSVACEEKG